MLLFQLYVSCKYGGSIRLNADVVIGTIPYADGLVGPPPGHGATQGGPGGQVGESSGPAGDPAVTKADNGVKPQGVKAALRMHNLNK